GDGRRGGVGERLCCRHGYDGAGMGGATNRRGAREGGRTRRSSRGNSFQCEARSKSAAWRAVGGDLRNDGGNVARAKRAFEKCNYDFQYLPRVRTSGGA